MPKGGKGRNKPTEDPIDPTEPVDPVEPSDPAPSDDIIIGTSGDDRLRGSNRNEKFQGGGGDDQILGGDGTDTAVYSGSVWDYSWRSTRKGWIVDDRKLWDGDDGRDELSGIEYLQFNDATIELGAENPTIIEYEPVHYVTYGESVDFSIFVSDYDNKLDLDNMGSDTNIGRVGITADRQSGSMGDQITLNGTFNSKGFFNSQDLTWLAKGETTTVTYSFELTSWKLFEVGSTTSTTLDVQFVVVGVNEAPTLVAEDVLLSVYEQGPYDTVDLSQFGDDVDSDDDGSSLTYEIVSATDGFSVSLEGTTLVYSPDNLDRRMTSDERVEGEVVIRAVDQHGAVSETITVDLMAAGVDQPTPVFVTETGVDFAALGVDPTDALNVGSQVAGFGLATDPFITSFSDGADLMVLNASRISGFDAQTRLYDEGGVEYSDNGLFDTGAGDDVLAFNIEDPNEALFELNDIVTGHGEDLVSVDVKGTTGIINGVAIDTGIHTDQVWLSLESDNGWINTSIGTGSGPDIVEIQMVDVDTGAVGGFGFANVDAFLGTGNDRLNVTVAAGERQLSTELNVAIHAGEGNDHVALSNVDTTLVIASTLPTGGSFDSLYKSGLEGSVFMDDGDDVLELALNDAYLSGAEARLDGGAGEDLLILHHLSAGDIAVTQETDDSYVIQDGHQRLIIDDFETVTLGDGSSLFDLV